MADDLGRVTTTSSKDGKVATIIIDREHKLNALTPVMIAQLEVATTQLAAQRPRVVILRTAGKRVFCVGADINLFSGLTPLEMWRDWTATGHHAFAAIEALPMPTLAIVDGLAYGGGLELALACDFRILREDAKVAFPETGLGTVPGWGGTSRTTALVGTSRAKEMILRRRPLAADEALRWGLVNAVAPMDKLDVEVAEWVTDLLGSSPVASAIAKQTINAAAAGAPASVVEALAGGLSMATEDLREGVSAFREKRMADFPGR